MNWRSRPFLNLARERRCYLDLPGCVGRDTVSAHSNLQRHGRGFAYKSHDLFTIPACPRCHHELDHGKNLTKVQREEFFMSAWERYIRDLIIEGKLCAKP